MVAFNPPGPPAFTQDPAINPLTGAAIVDTTDLVVPAMPMPDLVLPLASAGGYQTANVQAPLAILAELRVISYLLWANSATAIDLAALRADEYNGVAGIAQSAVSGAVTQ